MEEVPGNGLASGRRRRSGIPEQMAFDLTKKAQDALEDGAGRSPDARCLATIDG